MLIFQVKNGQSISVPIAQFLMGVMTYIRIT